MWRYSEDNVYLSNGWHWIDGNSDKVAVCYYLVENGIMSVNTVVDNYTINADGQWTVDGVIYDINQYENDLNLIHIEIGVESL